MFKKSAARTESEIKYEVLEELGTLSTNGDWETKLRYVKWGDNAPKYDIRAWKADESGEKCRKGITLTGEELEKLYGLLTEIAK